MWLYTNTPDISLVQKIGRRVQIIALQRTALDNQAMLPDAASAVLVKFQIVEIGLACFWSEEDHIDDTLVESRGVNHELKISTTQQTKLSLVSSVFDLICLIAPCALKALLLMKKIWRIHGEQRDDELPIDIQKKLLVWHPGLPFLGKMSIQLQLLHRTS